MHALNRSMFIRPGLIWLALLLTGLGLATVSRADEDEDPASRVARISYLRGPVYVQTADDNNWSDATINRPLTSGDQLWTDAHGRSELQMGSTTVQVDANTQLRIEQLTDNDLRLVITQGLINVRVRQLDRNDHVEFSTPNAAVTPIDTGTYRIDVADHDDVTVVQVRDGKVQIDGANRNFDLGEGEQISLSGTKRLTAEFDELGRPDEFDQWSNERNERASRVAAARYVSPDVIGYEDLDEYGAWRHYDDYGYVWVPTRVRVGWAPYRYGHWAWVGPWGWTWIDDTPWGFAPFHYGRWAMVERRWCWVPGPRTVRAVYAPALVAWVGTPGVSISITASNRPVGWIPLGPREVYRPYYHGSYNYVTRVNLSNTRIDHDEFERGYRRQPHENDFRNQRAAVVVNAEALRNAQPIGRHVERINHTQLQPLAAVPVARPERNDASDRSRQFTPPVTPNVRQGFTRRDNDDDRGNRNPGNVGRGEAPRNDARLNVNAPEAVRNNDMNRADTRDNSPWNSGRPSGDSRDNRFNGSRFNRDDNPAADHADETRPEMRNPQRDSVRDLSRDSSNAGQRAVNPPPAARTEVPAERPVPALSERTPRVRNDQGIPREGQLNRRESRWNNDAAPPHVERQRDFRTQNAAPNAPPPMRYAPPAQPRAANPDAGRPRGDDGHRERDR